MLPDGHDLAARLARGWGKSCCWYSQDERTRRVEGEDSAPTKETRAAPSPLSSQPRYRHTLASTIRKRCTALSGWLKGVTRQAARWLHWEQFGHGDFARVIDRVRIPGAGPSADNDPGLSVQIADDLAAAAAGG